MAIVAAQAAFTGRLPKVNATTSAAFKLPATRPANSALDSSKFANAFSFRADYWERAVGKVVKEIFAAKVPAAWRTPQT
jgi:dTDP-4-dehydrorhamnose reductase